MRGDKRRPRKKLNRLLLSKHLGVLAEGDRRDCIRDQDEADEELGSTMCLERCDRLERVLGTSNGRVVVADEERLAGLGEQARGEEEVGAARG